MIDRSRNLGQTRSPDRKKKADEKEVNVGGESRIGDHTGSSRERKNRRIERKRRKGERKTNVAGERSVLSSNLYLEPWEVFLFHNYSTPILCILLHLKHFNFIRKKYNMQYSA